MSGGSWIRIGAVDARLDAKTVNDLIKDTVGERLKSITQAPEVRLKIGEALVKQATPFVPYKTGDLSDSGKATSDGRVYWTSVHKGYNYANKLYDESGEIWGPKGYINPTRNKSPYPNHDPQPRWVERVVTDKKQYEAFTNRVREIIIEEHNKGNI